MPLRWTNSPGRYGALATLLHWTVFLLVLNQYVAAVLMTSIGRNEQVLGLTQGNLYNWHKSIGLSALAVVLVRYTWRKATALPDWAPGLAPWERTLAHAVERVLYGCLFLTAVTGFVFVMAGGYGVAFLGLWPLPNPIGEHRLLAWISQLTHAATAYALVGALGLHLGLVLKHQWVDRDGLLDRMLPFSRR